MKARLPSSSSLHDYEIMDHYVTDPVTMVLKNQRTGALCGIAADQECGGAQVMDHDVVIYRDMVESDRPFVFNSFARSYAAAADQNTRPYPIHCFAALLDRGVCKVAVAASDPDVIVGWALVVGRTLEYCYVKYAARRCGIARELVQAIGDVTHVGCTTLPWTREYAEGSWRNNV